MALKPGLVADIETVGTPFDGRVVSLAWQVIGEPRAHVVAVGHAIRQDPYPVQLLEMMADPERPFISFTKYDARFLRLSGIKVTGPFYDLQVLCWLYNENQSLALASVSKRYLNKQMDKRIRVRDKWVLFECDDKTLVPIDEAPLDQLYRYNIDDTETEANLFEEMWERLYDAGQLDLYLEEQVPYTEVLLDMECRGFPIDLERTKKFADELEGQHAQLSAELYDTAGLPPSFNINSNDQLAAYLYHKVFELMDSLEWSSDACECLKSCIAGEHEDCEEYHIDTLLPPGFSIDNIGRTKVHGRWTLRGRGLKPQAKTDNGKWSVSKPALKVNFNTASDSWVQRLLEYRTIDKLLTTYLRKFPLIAVNGRIYGQMNQTGTKTGRLSSSNPNLQNLPVRGSLGKRLRDLFRP